MEARERLCQEKIPDTVAVHHGYMLVWSWKAEEEALLRQETESQEAAVNEYVVVRGWTPSALPLPKIEMKTRRLGSQFLQVHGI